ncbi:MAG: hypothetical protein HY717_06850 [Planctomycetes bacterium]|nr:hypothetical protein [Planctomycetota bacterium]
MEEKPFGLLEMGSHSLKLYLVGMDDAGGYTITTQKFPWSIAHDFFLNGRVEEAALAEAAELIRGVEKVAPQVPLSSMIAVATGVFRELPNIDLIISRIKSECGVRVRVISGEDEAKLMAKSFQNEDADGSVFLFDLGGATMEWVWFQAGVDRGCGSLPLGAIRNEYKFMRLKENAAAYLQESSAYCDGKLEPLPFSKGVEVVGSGGTAKALSACFGKDIVTLEELRLFMERVLREGAPEILKPSRRAVFLPGLVIIWRVLVRCQAKAVKYGNTSVRNGMAGRLVRLLGTHRREDLHATLLLHSSKIF